MLCFWSWLVPIGYIPYKINHWQETKLGELVEFHGNAKFNVFQKWCNLTCIATPFYAQGAIAYNEINKYLACKFL